MRSIAIALWLLGAGCRHDRAASAPPESPSAAQTGTGETIAPPQSSVGPSGKPKPSAADVSRPSTQ